MQLIVNERTQRRLVERMADRGFTTLDEAIESMLDETDVAAGPPGLLGPPTDDELDAALDEADRNPGIPWHEAKAKLMSKYNIREA